MPEPLSDRIFPVGDGRVRNERPKRCLAGDLGLNEAWFRDAIFEEPELVIAPCRAAGLTDDDWYPWANEYKVDVGPIDVLLISDQGKVAIVETKLSGNPELRRRVLAQALDYLTHLPEALETNPPPIPLDENGLPVADADDVRSSIREGDVLVLVVSDQIDDRAARLSRTLIGEHLTNLWDLVLIDLALFRHDDAADGEYWVVPCVRGMVAAEARQVVRVIVEGETPSARVEVFHSEDEGEPRPARQRWDERRFFERIRGSKVPDKVRTFAEDLRDLAGEYPATLKLAWGTGKKGSMVLKRKDNGVVELYGSGELRFRTRRFAGALGNRIASDYRRALDQMFPGLDKYKYISAAATAEAAPALSALIRRSIEQAEAAESSDS